MNPTSSLWRVKTAEKHGCPSRITDKMFYWSSCNTGGPRAYGPEWAVEGLGIQRGDGGLSRVAGHSARAPPS